MTQKRTVNETALGESVVDEVRAIREAIDKEAGHDLRLLAERARRTSEDVRRQYGLKAAQALKPEAETNTGRAG